MKHLLNDLSDEEKNSIREQHTGGKKLVIENFNKLVNTKLGDAKPFLNEQTEEANINKTIQCFLNKKGITDDKNQKIVIDGSIGRLPNSKSAQAIAKYQSNIGVTADGVWGDETSREMPPADKAILKGCVNDHSDIIDKAINTVLDWFGF
jgi:hypothetical protein